MLTDTSGSVEAMIKGDGIWLESWRDSCAYVRCRSSRTKASFSGPADQMWSYLPNYVVQSQCQEIPACLYSQRNVQRVQNTLAADEGLR